MWRRNRLVVQVCNWVRTELAARSVARSSFPREQRLRPMRKLLLRFVHIMRTAAQFQVLSGGRAALGVRHHMMEFEKSCFTAAPCRTPECTLAALPTPYLALDCSRHVSRASLTLVTSSWTGGGRELGLGQIREQQRQSAIENRRGIAVRNAVPHADPAPCEACRAYRGSL